MAKTVKIRPKVQESRMFSFRFKLCLKVQNFHMHELNALTKNHVFLTLLLTMWLMFRFIPQEEQQWRDPSSMTGRQCNRCMNRVERHNNEKARDRDAHCYH